MSALDALTPRRVLLLALLGIAGCAKPPTAPNPAPSVAIPERPTFSQTGEASWYGPDHQGAETAAGERFNMKALTAAHRSLPFETITRVTSLDTGKSVTVRINDRGPYVRGRIIDLSSAAASALGMDNTAMVRIEVFPSDQVR